MKIIITGVAGFIGSNLADFLMEKSSTIGIDNFQQVKKISFKGLYNKSFILLRQDIDQLDVNNNNFKNVDAIIHLAAMQM